ncbi:MAG TPA: cyanophycin synthetase, partial [Abditibacteriaceae bacterium]
DHEAYFPLLWTHEIPATLGGLSRANIANALAATAIAYALKVPIETIRAALQSFVPSFESNPGRLNVWDKLPFKVVMDYAHNPAAMEHIGTLVKGLRPQHQRVIGVLSGTGDRRDQDLVEMGQLIGGMVDELIIKEDERRGRKPGETSALIKQGALDAGLKEEAISGWLPEKEAVQTALEKARPGDLVLIFASRVNAVWKQITSYKPKQTQ